ncbi:GntR family transcriptional regulator [Streptomyces sp. HNM0663]|uniref:GntR family transcriptional regulator n=1 Tax=Streptomyces chengmaiensis TaxID=3040919 RepID=A0ABT6HX30_9ACTN|nr:GntR family transcriptional regulator [Streptomyces chengmaiensis]MDH2393140.1 GntR family transcriptional regulator [Streptomyces chengmaiensis]
MSGEGQGDRPISQQIAEELRAAINDGTYPPGGELPSQRRLAEQYSAARNTVAEALKLLERQGLITSQWGRGVFVREHKPLIRLGSDRYSPKYRESGLSPFLIECEKQGKTGRFDVLGIEKVKPDKRLADQLKVSPKAKSVLRRENVFYADDDPVYRVTTWIPWSIAQGTGLVEAEVPHQYGIHGIFEEKGHVMTRIHDEITARMPTPEEVGHLELPQGVPVIEVMHTSLDQDGEPYEVTRFVMRADMNGLSYNVPVE